MSQSCEDQDELSSSSRTTEGAADEYALNFPVQRESKRLRRNRSIGHVGEIVGGEHNQRHGADDYSHKDSVAEGAIERLQPQHGHVAVFLQSTCESL